MTTQTKGKEGAADLALSIDGRSAARRKVRLYLLDKARMVGRNGVVVLPQGHKMRGLLTYLCCAGNERVPRSCLTRLIWARSPNEQAKLSLRQALAELRRAAGTDFADLLEVERETVRLKPVWIDVLASPDRADRLLADLEGISPAFDRWIATQRRRLEDGRRSRLEQELEQLVADNASPQLRLAAARKLVAFDPTHEQGVRHLMAALAQSGDRPGAIREYERFRDSVRDALQLSPAPETEALYRAIVAGSADAPAAMPPPSGAAPPPPPLSAPAVRSASYRPAIAVLPFRDLSVECVYRDVGSGLAEDLMAGLARVPDVSVVSRLAALAAGNRDRGPREIAEALGAQYILSGTVRAAAGRLRLTAELTDGRSGAALCTSRIETGFADLLDVQAVLAHRVVGRIAPVVRATELKRARLTRPEQRDAYDCLLCALETMHNFSPVVFDSARLQFDRAIELDPSSAAAPAWRAYWHLLRVGQGWSRDPAADIEEAASYAGRAVGCEFPEAMAFAIRGHVAAYLRKDFDAAFRSFETALRLDPDNALAWLWKAAAHAYTGQGRQAVQEIDRAMKLSPYHPAMYAFTSIASLACLSDGQIERGIMFADRSMRENETYTTAVKLLVMGLGLAERASEARAAARRLLELEPAFTVDEFRRRSPTSASALGDAYCRALAAAGIPRSD
jgi:DNA-binding SARP family transcriptional activator/TolB-like protein